MKTVFAFALILVFCCTLIFSGPAVLSGPTVSAALPPEVRKELASLQKDLRSVTTLVRKKEVDEAKALIRKVEDRLAELAISDDEKDRSFTALKSTLERSKLLIPVSFEQQVAPILKDNCVSCHDADSAGGMLRLDTYTNMTRGSRSGPLAIPGRPLNSLIMAKIMTPDMRQRMPRNAAKLSDEDISLIGRWIEQGAEFDGEDKDAMIGESTTPKKPPVKVVMADGSETVSFMKDVAPFLVTICLGCHSGNNPRGGYNVTTFEQLLSDGDTGSTIVPGNPDESYIVDLVLRQDPLKMPAGQARIKQSQALALEKWIREGAHFDGRDPKAPLRSLVPTDAEIEAARLAAMSDEDFSKRRIDQAASIWKQVSPRAEGVTHTTDNLVVHGNVTDARLKQFGEWGESHLAGLMEKYKLPSGSQPWRGRLIVFVTKDRFDYEEFNTVLMDGRRTPKSISGHAFLTPRFETMYVAMHDVGDTESANSMSAQQLLNSLLSEAYLNRSGASLPDWLRQGFGMMESGMAPGSEFAKALPGRAIQALSTITDASRIFENNTFAPDEVGPVGYLLVRFLISNGGVGKIQQLIGSLSTNPNVGQAIQQAYGTSAANLGQAFMKNGR
ncbi:MAG: hypothetical protein KDA91_09875 [Planctomycetaceae bacterium]|nr:hypothetical protein [Planctomycetaceae bacterium]